MSDETKTRIDELTRQLADEQNRARSLEDEIGKLDLQRSPEFVEKYDRPIAAIRDQLVEQFRKGGIAEQEANDLALRVLDSTTVDEVQNAVAELPTALQGMAMFKFNEADGLFGQRDQALREWRETQAGLAQVAKREHPVIDAERRRSLCDTGFDRVSKVVDFWNDPVFVRHRTSEADKVRAWFANAPEDQVVAAAVEGALVAPFAYSQIALLQQKLAEAYHALEGRTRAGAPSVAPYYRSAPVQPPPAPSNAPSKDDIAMDDPVAYARRMLDGTAQGMGVQLPR